MTFWNRKKQSSVELEEAFRRFTESMSQSNANVVRSTNELTKALNNATKEFKRSRS